MNEKKINWILKTTELSLAIITMTGIAYELFRGINGLALPFALSWYIVQLIRMNRANRIAIEEIKYLANHMPNCNCMDATEISKAALLRVKDL